MKQMTLDTKIDRIRFPQLDARICNCLKDAGINTLGQLVEMEAETLLKIPGFGKKCLIIVQDFLEEQGLLYGTEDRHTKTAESPVPVKEIDWEQRRYETARDIMASFTTNWRRDIAEWTPESRAEHAVRMADALIIELKKNIIHNKYLTKNQAQEGLSTK